MSERTVVFPDLFSLVRLVIVYRELPSHSPGICKSSAYLLFVATFLFTFFGEQGPNLHPCVLRLRGMTPYSTVNKIFLF